MHTPFSEEQRQQIRDSDVETLAKCVFRELKKNSKTYLDGSEFAFKIDYLGLTQRVRKSP